MPIPKCNEKEEKGLKNAEKNLPASKKDGICACFRNKGELSKNYPKSKTKERSHIHKS
jgi:hypothetical protein